MSSSGTGKRKDGADGGGGGGGGAAKKPCARSAQDQIALDQQLLGAGDARTVQALLAAGADKEAKDSNGGFTALILASFHGHTEIAQALLAAGADKEAKNNDGWTTLIHASYRGHTPRSCRRC